MILLFDIGNTRIKWAVTQSDRIVNSGVLMASQMDKELLGAQFKEFSAPKSIWISCVGSERILGTLLDSLDTHFYAQPQIAQVSEFDCRIKNAYQDITSLGVDRWLAVIGARSMVKNGDVIIIDVGTAVTIDWLSADNVFEGGVILPGLALMHDSLVGHTVGIESELLDKVQIIGKNTQECVNSGVSYGLGGAVERIVEEMQNTIGRSVNLLITGGGTDTLIPVMKLKALHVPQLVLIGLLELALDTGT